MTPEWRVQERSANHLFVTLDNACQCFVSVDFFHKKTGKLSTFTKHWQALSKTHHRPILRVLFLSFFVFFLVSGSRPPGIIKKEGKCRPSRNTGRHCPNASPAYLESIIWPRVTQRSVSKISKCVFFVTFGDVFCLLVRGHLPLRPK